MAIPISDVTRRVVYSGSAGVGPYSFSFEILAETDIAVYKDTTLLTLTTDYSVTINVDGTGSITLVTAATGSNNIAIVGDRGIARTTDFVTGGDLFANSLNDELDSLTIFSQQVKETADRALKAPVTDPTDVNMTLPAKADRLGTVLGFNATTGDPEAGPAIADVGTLAAITADISTLADIEDGTDATDAIQTVAGISNNVTTVAGISSNVTTVATNNSNVTTVATDLAGSDNIGTVAGSIANVNTTATSISDVNTVATNIASVNTVATSISDVITVANDLNEAVAEIDTVAGSIANVDAVGTDIANVNTVATNIANVNTVAGISSDVTTVAADGTDIGVVAGASADITTVAGQISPTNNISTVAGVAANVATVAGISSDVTTVAGNSANVTTVAGISGNVTTVAGISADVTTVAADGTDIGTVATNIADVNTVAGISSNVTAVANDATDIGTVATDLTGSNTIGTVAGIAANVTTVAGISSDVTTVAADGTDIGTVATNIANVNTVAGISANVTTVAGDSADIATLAGITSSITQVAFIDTDVTAVANDYVDIGLVASDILGPDNTGTVATNIANVNTVAGISSDVTTVASNVADVTNFADVYYGPAASDPSTRKDASALQAGDLYFNTTDDVMHVYDGTAWEAVTELVTLTNTSTSANFYIPFANDYSTGNYALGADAGLYYNPAINTLSTGSVIATTIYPDVIDFTDGTSSTEHLRFGSSDDIKIYYDGATDNALTFFDGTNVILELFKTSGNLELHGKMTVGADPTANLEVATKQYVDNATAAALHYHDPVRVETPTALTATYNNGSSGVGATLTNSGTQAALEIDGITLSTNDRVLVYNQATPAHNGVYTVTTVGDESTNWVLTRATDADSYGASDPDSLGQGDSFFVLEGDTGAGESYVLTTQGTITFGTTDITFSQFAAAPAYGDGTLTMSVAGVGLSGSQTFTANQTSNATFTVTSNATDANTASTVVARDASGNFNAGTITANLTGNVTGNADTATSATSATTATNATNVALTKTSTAASFYIPFASGYQTGNYALGVDSGFYYNPSANQVSALSFYASYLYATGFVQLTGDSDYVVWGSGSDTKMFYDGVNNTFEMELETDATSFIITDNGTTRFTFDKTSGDFTATGKVVDHVEFTSTAATAYTLVAGDQGNMVKTTSASAVTITVPTNASVGYSVGAKIDLVQYGAGQITVAGDTGVTVNATPTLKTRAQYSAASLVKVATDEWLLVGDLADS